MVTCRSKAGRKLVTDSRCGGSPKLDEAVNCSGVSRPIVLQDTSDWVDLQMYLGWESVMELYSGCVRKKRCICTES
jgi:hypothetical protein